jgi:hypothetical protein
VAAAFFSSSGGKTMFEIWLRPNRRVLAMAIAPAAAVSLVGLALAQAVPPPIVIAGWALVVLGIALMAGLLWQMRRPRVAFRDGHVLFYLRAGQPIAVPVVFVEAFFLGQGPARLPTAANPAETVNLIARISQKAPHWAQVVVKPALGAWCDGYVTVRGAWCETLTAEVIRKLNRRLREVHESASTLGAPPSHAEADR